VARAPVVEGVLLTNGGPMVKSVYNKGCNTLDAIVARLAVCDGLSFNVLATSCDILLVAMYCDVPKSHNTVHVRSFNHVHQLKTK